MHRASLCALTFAAFGSVFAFCQSPGPAVVAVASESILSTFNAAGDAVQRIEIKQPVAGFAFSPDRRKLVIVSPDTEHGGALILIDLMTGSRKRLTNGPFAFRHLNKGEAEVYDSPAFSPDGRTLVFAVHGNQPGDGNDAWENSGPLAVLDLAGGKPRVLVATNNIDGNGPCSEGDPQWSPDGKWILFNCEDGAFVTDPQGKTLRKLKIDADNASSSSVGWVGTKCVLFTQVPAHDGHFDFDHESAKLLDLGTSQVTDASALLGKFGASEGGIEQASADALIRQEESKLIIQTIGKRWEIALKPQWNQPQTVSAQLLTGWEYDQIPAECK